MQCCLACDQQFKKAKLQRNDVVNAAFYPGIYVAVKTLLTYPVSACAAERSFSSMKRLKTPLRNTMTDDRLSSLVILHIHKENEVNVESVLDNLHSTKKTASLFAYK